MTTAAIVAVGIFGVVTVFQLLLALGAPWGAAAWGGQHPGVLPTGYRIGSAVSGLVVFPLIAAYVAHTAGLIDVAWFPGGAVVMWVLLGFFALGTLMNAISRSRIERVWAPVNLVLVVCCLLIALEA